MGLTFLTVGNCMPDFLVSIAAVKNGLGNMAISNCFGATMFDFCIGLGLPYTLETCIVHPGSSIQVNSEHFLEPLMFLGIAMISLIIGSACSNWHLSKGGGALQLTLYLVFVMYLFVTGF
jgi:sodium/potassium/calcium exchanger 4